MTFLILNAMKSDILVGMILRLVLSMVVGTQSIVGIHIMEPLGFHFVLCFSLGASIRLVHLPLVFLVHIVPGFLMLVAMRVVSFIMR
jgi:hypothetical protein